MKYWQTYINISCLLNSLLVCAQALISPWHNNLITGQAQTDARHAKHRIHGAALFSPLDYQ